MKLTLYVWRQANREAQGAFKRYELSNVNHHMSFLEMLDVLNEELLMKGEEPVAFEHDCREGICGCCSLVINGRPHGPQTLTTTCQLHMRHFKDGQSIYIEPWRSAAFPVIKDLVVDRGAFERIIESGGYISVNTGAAPEANGLPVSKNAAEESMDAAQCIACGACVAACPNGSAMLFTAAKISHLGLLPQGQPERYKRAMSMVHQMDSEGFGACTNHGECQDACPKGISIKFISRMNRDFLWAHVRRIEESRETMRAQ